MADSTGGTEMPTHRAACALWAVTVVVASLAGTTASGALAAASQSFTGAAAGPYSEAEGVLLSESGSFATTGQLGSGRFTIMITPAANWRMTVTRADGVSVTGVSANPDEFDLSGSADLRHVHLRLAVFEDRIDVAHSSLPHHVVGTRWFTVSGSSAAFRQIGYWILSGGGTVNAFGGADRQGDAPGGFVTHIEPTASGRGYWIVNAAGKVFAFGDAQWFGELFDGYTKPVDPRDGCCLGPGEFVIAFSATPADDGYWLFTNRGHAFAFGNAELFGDASAVALNAPVVDSAATATGGGYYMVASDGGVFAFGDARYRGSMGGVRLNQPVRGIVVTADGRGYWLVASDGGVFSFGSAPFRGSMAGVRLNRPVIAMTRYGRGYLMVASDGGVFNFSSAPFFGSLAGATSSSAVAGVAAVS